MQFSSKKFEHFESGNTLKMMKTNTKSNPENADYMKSDTGSSFDVSHKKDAPNFQNIYENNNSTINRDLQDLMDDDSSEDECSQSKN